MLGWFSALTLANKVIAVAVALALIASILGGAYWWAYSKGHEAGYGDGQRSQLEIDRKAFEQERATFLATLAHYQEQDDAAKQKIAQKDSEISAIKASRSAARDAVNRLPAGRVVADIQAKLGSPESPQLDDAQLRRLDEMLSDYVGLQAQLSALESKSQQQDARIVALEGQRDAAVQYGNEVTKHYIAAYNAAQKHHSLFVRIISLGLVRDRKLDLPSPASLHR